MDIRNAEAGAGASSEGRHTPLQLLIYLRNPENAAALDENYITQNGNDTKAKKKQHTQRQKAFQDYIRDNSEISNEPRNPKKPMHKFINMPQPVCEYIRPTLKRMKRERNYATYFKKTDPTSTGWSKLSSVNMYIERILDIMGKKVGPPRNRKHHALVEEDKIPELNAISPRERAATGTETPVAERDNNKIELAVAQLSLISSAGKMKTSSAEYDAEIMQNLSKQYCAICKEKFDPEPWFVSLQCIHRVCFRCASTPYRWIKYMNCQFCKRYIKASCRRLPDGTSVGLTDEKNPASFIQINQTGYDKLEFETKNAKFMSDLESGRKLVFAEIKDGFFQKNSALPAEKRIVSAQSVEMLDADVRSLFANIIMKVQGTEKLVMLNCKSVRKNIQEVIKYSTQSIVNLTLCNCKINDHVMKLICSYGDEFERIRELVLEENRLTKNSGPLIAGFVRNKPYLSNLTLSGNFLGDGYVDVVKAITGSQSMKVLGLGKNEIARIDPAFVDMLRLTNLDEVSLHTNPLIGSEGTKVLAQGIEQNHSIRFLWIRNINMEDPGAKVIAKALAKNDSLIEIGMGSNNITEKGVSYIATALKKNKWLKALYLNWNILTARSVHKFAIALGVNKSLKLLGIQTLRLTSDWVEAICELIGAAKGLEHLLMGMGSFITTAERERLLALSKAASEKGEGPLIQDMK
ncbi:MAG: hypothetical protein P4L69_19305 [Desulfosporosinus sp.]|nr:hypothetical protein [Desulfosporosinus sp.]